MPKLSSSLQSLVQRTGSANRLASASQRIAFTQNVSGDISNIVQQLNTVYRPLMAALASDSELEALDYGLSGNIIFTHVRADAASAEAYWDSVNKRSTTIKESFDVLLSEISRLENVIAAISDISLYDDSDVRGLIALSGLDIVQLARDTTGRNYTLDGDGQANNIYPLSQAIDALGAFFSGFPGTGNNYSSAYPALSFSVLLSNVAVDTTLPQSTIAGLTTDLGYLRSFIGMGTTGPETPVYSDHGALVNISDGDSLEEAIQKIDTAVGTSGLSGTLVAGDTTSGQNIIVSYGDKLFLGDNNEVEFYYDSTASSGLGSWFLTTIQKDTTGPDLSFAGGFIISSTVTVPNAGVGLSGLVIISSPHIVADAAGSTASTTGPVFLTSGNSTSVSGTSNDTGFVTVTSGVSDDADSGQVALRSGGAPSGRSGAVRLATGDSGLNSGNVSLDTGDTTGSASSGDVTLDTGATAGAAIDSGGIRLTSGAAAGAGSSSGPVLVRSGASAIDRSGQVDVASGIITAGIGTSGAVNVKSGSTVNGNSGAVRVESGASSGSNSGAATVSTGSGDITGDTVISTGNASAGDSGDVNLTTGTATVNRGVIKLNAPAIDSTSETDFEWIAAGSSDQALKLRNTNKVLTTIAYETAGSGVNDVYRFGPQVSDLSSASGASDSPTKFHFSQHSDLQFELQNIGNRIKLHENFELIPGASISTPTVRQNKSFYFSTTTGAITFTTGWLDVATGAVSNDYAIITPMTSVAGGQSRWGKGYWQTGGQVSIAACFQLQLLTNQRFEFGVRQSVNAFDDTTNADKFFLRYDSASDANWFLVTSKSGVDTATSTGVAATTGVTTLRLLHINDDIYVYINETLVLVVANAMNSSDVSLGTPYIALKSYAIAGRRFYLANIASGHDLL